jgi:hypothetical protein
MCKISPSTLNGLEFIRLSHLPFQQAQRLIEWIPTSSFMKLKIAGKDVEDCIPYAEYECWYNYQYQASSKMNFELYL